MCIVAFYLEWIVRSRITQGRLVGWVGGAQCTFCDDQLLLKQITREVQAESYNNTSPNRSNVNTTNKGELAKQHLEQCEQEVGAECCKTNGLDETFLI